MKRHVFAPIAVVLGFVVAPAAAQPPGPAQRGVRLAPPAAERPAAATGEQTADETRDELSRVLEQYPPTLPQVLVLDPSLLAATISFESPPISFAMDSAAIGSTSCRFPKNTRPMR